MQADSLYLTRTSSAAATGSEAENLSESFAHKKNVDPQRVAVGCSAWLDHLRVLEHIFACTAPVPKRSHCVIRKRVIYLGRRPVIQRGSHGLIRVANLFLNRTRKRE